VRAAALLVLVTTGCGSFTHFQTAKALEAGKFSLEYQGAAIAMHEGVHAALRARAGLGKGFDVGLETDMVSLVLLEFGMTPEDFGLILGDVKWQALYESDEMPVSAALGFGGGTGSATDFYFGQATISRAFDFVEPYLAYRYQRFHVDVDLDEADDLEDLENSFLIDIFEQVQGTRFGLNHVFFGVKFTIAGTFFIIPEASWIFGEAEGTGSVGLSFGFQFP
jgi:hypothetical protein